MEDKLIPFGKYKGKPVEILTTDKQYTDWLLAQSWFKEKHINLYHVVINNFREPVDTPEHNALQVKFLNYDYRIKLAYLLDKKLFECNSKYINERICKTEENGEHSNRINLIETIKKLTNKNLINYTIPIFEGGKDVSFAFSYGLDLRYCLREPYDFTTFSYKRIASFEVEIKPSISDDFPAILRQMKTSMPIKHGWGTSYCLIYKEYTGKGATKEEFINYFQTQGYHIVHEPDIEKVELPEIEKFFVLDESF